MLMLMLLLVLLILLLLVLILLLRQLFELFQRLLLVLPKKSVARKLKLMARGKALWQLCYYNASFVRCCWKPIRPGKHQAFKCPAICLGRN